MAYIVMVNIRDSTQGTVNNIGNNNIRRLIGKAWLGHSKPQFRISWRGKQWYPRSLKHPRRQDVAVGP